MKIIIPSFQRAATATTHRLLEAEGIDYHVILHNSAEYHAYCQAGSVPPERLLVSHQPPGISHQRAWILEQLVAPGEWFLTLDDNIRYFTTLPDDLYRRSRQPETLQREFWQQRCTVERVLEIVEDTMREADRRGAWYAGFAVVDNGFFRKRKWRDVGYVISKAALIRKGYAEYDLNLRAMDDYGFTAENLMLYGRVLINNYLYPIAGHYQQGGIGTYQARLPAKLHDAAYLMRKYPGLFRYQSKSGCHKFAELVVRFHSVRQVHEWLSELASKPPG